MADRVRAGGGANACSTAGGHGRNARTTVAPRAALHAVPTAAVAAGDVLRLATVRVPGASTPEVAALRGERVWPLGATYPGGMTELIGAWRGSNALAAQLSGAGLPLADVALLAPVPSPGAIICVGKNYADHVKEMDAAPFGALTRPAAPVAPIIFSKSPLSVVGPGADIMLPVDYEGELAAVIGIGGKRIARADALSHVFGFTVVNDVSARDLQKTHQQWYLAKSCDTFCPMGPWLVPADSLDARALQLRTWVNGELRQDGNTRNMLHDLAALIETASAAATLRTGDLIVTGTPAGVGAAMTPPRFLAPGDVVRVEIEGIGVLENRVALPAAL